MHGHEFDYKSIWFYHEAHRGRCTCIICMGANAFTVQPNSHAPSFNSETMLSASPMQKCIHSSRQISIDVGVAEILTFYYLILI